MPTEGGLGQHRRTGYAGHSDGVALAGRSRAPARAHPLSPPPLPWEVTGPPYGLTAQDFQIAARVVVAGIPEGNVRPLHGAWGAYFYCYGTQYPHNAARLDELAQVPPLIRDGAGRAIHPAILVPDPSAGEGSAPLGVSIVCGYIGSVYCEPGERLRGTVDRGMRRRLLLATRAAIVRVGEGEWEVEVWLPVEAEWPTTRSVT